MNRKQLRSEIRSALEKRDDIPLRIKKDINNATKSFSEKALGFVILLIAMPLMLPFTLVSVVMKLYFYLLKDEPDKVENVIIWFGFIPYLGIQQIFTGNNIVSL
jgi:hypothetical protein